MNLSSTARSLSIALAVALLPLPAFAQTPLPLGEDFQVNVYTTSNQGSVALGADADGDFVVVWSSNGSDMGDEDLASVFARLFTSDGIPASAPFQVNTYTTDRQSAPAIAVEPDGGFLVVWSRTEITGPNDSIEGRRYDSSGTPIGDQFQIPEYTTDVNRPAIVRADDGRFLVVWSGDTMASLDTTSNLHGRFLDASGLPTGSQFQINTYTTDDQDRVAIAEAPDGAFVVVWESEQADGDSDGSIQGQRLASDGSLLGNQFQVNTYTTSQQESPGLGLNANGDFLVTWESDGSFGDDDAFRSIQGQRLSSDGTFIGGQFQINTYTTSSQTNPSVVSNDENWIVFWSGDGPGDTDSAEGQRLASDGSFLGSQFQVNSYTTGDIDSPSATFLDSSTFVVAWSNEGSAGTDSDLTSIQTRRVQLSGGVGDRVFLDSDFDGIQDMGEAGIEGVRVNLYDSLGTLLDSTQTDAQGDYLFSNQGVLDEIYLEFEAPVDYAFTPRDQGDDDGLDSDADPPSGQTVDFLPTADIVDDSWDAGLASGIGDRVWSDLDADGIQDGSEPGISAVTVQLFDAQGGEQASTTTDADGFYAFSTVAPGDYYVVFTAPAGMDFTAPDQGLDESLDSDADPETGESPLIVFAAGDLVLDIDAGVTAEVLASVGDRVWLDSNMNGIQDGGEVGFEGVTVELFDHAGVSQGTTTSSVDGTYGFTDLAAGDYYLGFSEPAGYCYTARDQGNDDGLDSDVAPDTFTTPVFSLGDGAADSSRDAGLVPDASVGNRVWLDDGDGIQAGGEAGIEHVIVNLYAASGVQLDTTTTDSSGAYAFSPGPGDFYLEFVLPADMAFAPGDRGGDDSIDSDAFASTGTTSIFTLGPGEVDSSRDAGLEPAVIGNRVWDDLNGDGRQQPGEPGQEGITVRLLDASDGEVASTTTDANGVYGFLGVPTGTYRIEVLPTADGVFSSQDAGANDLIDSDVDPATGRSEFFAYSESTASRSWDAGLRLLPLFGDGFESGDLSAWAESLP